MIPVHVDDEIDRLAGFRIGKVGSPDGCSEYCRNFPCDTENTLAVGSVGSYRNIEDIIVNAEDGLNVRSDLCIVREHKESVVACTRVHVLTHTELRTGAEHTEGIISAKLALTDRHDTLNRFVILSGRIYGSAHERERELLSRSHIIGAAGDLMLLSAVVNLAERKVCTLDGLAALNKSDDYFADVPADFIFLFYFESAREKLFLKLVRSNVYINIIF